MYQIQELNGLMGDLLAYASEMCGYDVDSPTEAIDALQECGVDGAYDLISDIADIMGQIDSYNRINENKGMKIKKNGKVIRLTESDLKKIVKRVITEQMEEFEGEEFINRLPPNIGTGHKLMNDNGSKIEVITNNGIDAIEDKDAVEIMMGSGYVNRLPNLMEFPNLFVVNFSDSSPLTDIDVDSLINNKRISRVIFNYVDSPMMNSKVNELENRSEELGMMIMANKVEIED